MLPTSDSDRFVPLNLVTFRVAVQLLGVGLLLLSGFGGTTVFAQVPAPANVESSPERKIGYWIDVPSSLGATGKADEAPNAVRLVARLSQLADATREGTRTTVLLRMQAAEKGSAASFEDALKVARALGQGELRRLKIVTFIEGELDGHRQLIALASEQLLVSDDGSLGGISDSDAATDETMLLAYESIARRRGLVPPAIVAAMLDRRSELVQLTTVEGQQRLASGEELATARKEGQVLSEEVWKQAGSPLRLGVKRLREARAVAGVVNSLNEAADVLDVAELVSANSTASLGTPKGVLIEIKGSIARSRARRWQSNLVASLESGNVNTWLVEMDSSGGSFDISTALAASFALPQPPLQTAAGLITGEARGDAALIAMACRPLMMTADARLGGPGSEVIGSEDLSRHDELIDQIAVATKRSPALIRGLLNPELEVYRFTDRKTGRVRYATQTDVDEDQADAKNEATPDQWQGGERWQRGERIDLNQGLGVKEAIALGLADAEVDSIQQAAGRIGLDAVPPAIVDRPIVRFVEKIGRSNALMFILLMIGFFTLSAEAGAPGLGVPGFISMLCFSLYVWMKFLAGTAEWLELIALALGLTCIAIEIFIVPGIGIFGVGGLILTVLGIVLMSQTFVIPQNSYQIEVLTRSVWGVLAALIGLVGGFVAMRSMMPHVPLLNQLVMESGDAEALDRHERMADYGHLTGQVGVATTVLRPGGKARFGETIVAVISDGSALEAGDSVRVREVHGNRIVVEAVES